MSKLLDETLDSEAKAQASLAAVAASGVRSRFSRFSMLAGMAGGALGALSIVACSSNGSTPAAAQSFSDADVLNFALNLEYLEAEFYAYATTGQGIAAQGIGTSGVGTAGATTGGVQTTFTNTITQSVAGQIAADETQHVTLLRAALGAAAIAKPAINLSAGGSFATMAQFLALSRAFEDTGVSAYIGAAPLLTSKSTLGTAAQILAMEAYHSGNIRLQIAQQGVATTATDGRDVIPPPSGTDYFDDIGALALSRTTTQVIAIVKPFFPNGLNGAITS